MVTDAVPEIGSDEEDGAGGFATLDDQGRIALAQATRRALNLQAGSSVTYVVVDGAILLVPQADDLARMSDHAARVLQEAGLTTEDLLAELPAVRGEILCEDYGAEFVEALARAHEAAHGARA